METETSETNILPIVSFIYDDSIDTSSIQNVLLIDSSVKEFQQYANANTFPIVYTRSCTREQLLTILSSKFNNISRIAIVCHFSESLLFLNEDILFSEMNTQCIVDITKQFHLTHIDFLACDTLQSTLWTTFYATLYAATGIPIGASNDNTGNIKYGGDWILESTQEDIQTIYFNDQIQNYSSLLISFIPPPPPSIQFISNNLFKSSNYVGPFTNGISSQYQLTPTDLNGYIRGELSYRLSGTPYTVSKTIQIPATTYVIPDPFYTPPTQSGLPVILDGDLFKGTTLSAILNINPQPYISSYIWSRANTPDMSNFIIISDENDKTYVLRQEDIGKYINVQITYIDSYGIEKSASNKNGPIQDPGIVDISGTATQNQTISAILTDIDNPTNISYQWLRSSTVGGIYSNIPDASNQTYILTQDDANKYIQVTVTYNDDYNVYWTTSVTSVIGPIEALPVANICFKAGTKIATDQGVLSIETITENHSILGKKVLFVSKTANIDNYMVLMKKGSLYKNVPNEDTFLTGCHKVFYNRCMVKAKDLVNGTTIIKEACINETVYNILLEENKVGKMIANGMITETLSPLSPFSQILMELKKMNVEEKNNIISKLNKELHIAHKKQTQALNQSQKQFN